MIIQTFYNVVTQVVQCTIDVVAEGTLMKKMEDEGFNLIEEMALNNFPWPTKRGQPKQVGGKLEVDTLTFLSTKVNAVTLGLNRMNVNAVNSSAHPLCENCSSIEHVTLNF